jgi:hypothetical protein
MKSKKERFKMNSKMKILVMMNMDEVENFYFEDNKITTDRGNNFNRIEEMTSYIVNRLMDSKENRLRLNEVFSEMGKFVDSLIEAVDKSDLGVKGKNRLYKTKIMKMTPLYKMVNRKETL